jgi:hypothetical protein
LVGLRNFGAIEAELAVAGTGMFKVFKAWSAGSVWATSVGRLISLAYLANATAAPFERVTEFFNPFNHMRLTGGGPFTLPS